MPNIPKLRLMLARMESRRYETLVKPSQLQSVLLNNRVLPATAKGRELLQTGTMPAGAKLPPEILKSAGWMDMVQRAIAKLPGRAVPTTPIGNVVYRGFVPAVEDARYPWVHGTAHPQVAAGYTIPVHDWKDVYGKPSADFANWAKNKGEQHQILRTFEVDPQVQKHFVERGLLGNDAYGSEFRTAAQSAFMQGGRTLPEIQQFLKKTPWYQSSVFPAKKMLQHMSYETKVFPNSFTGLASYNPSTRIVTDIPHNIAKDLVKGAGVFTASGNKVQGVGLRKLYHSLLDERGLTGLGVNNEDTGDVELSFDGDDARRQEVFKELAARIKAKTSHPVTFAPTAVPQTSTPVKLSNKDSERLNAIHHLAYRMSNMYDPTHPLMDPNDTFKQKLADRFRLQVNKGGLTGTVPSRAAEQLLGTRPMYAGMMPARRTRSEAEALSDMPMAQQQRLLKALKSGRGFLAPVVDKLASAAVEAPMNLYSYIPII
jgi:acylphosphatase